MSFSDREIDELKKEVERAVDRFLGHKDATVISTCLKCADRGYDRKKSRDRLKNVMSEQSAGKLADKLMILVDDFKSSLKRNRKRRDDTKEEIIDKKRKRIEEDLSTSIVTPAATAAANAAALKGVMSKIKQEDNGNDQPGLDSIYAKLSPGQLTAAKIKEVMAGAQKVIAQRKHELGMDESEVFVQPKKEQNVGDTISAANKAKRFMDLQAQIAARLANTNLPNLLGQPPESASKLNLAAGLMTPTGSGKSKEAMKNVIIDDQGRTIDVATGEVLQLLQHAPTLKANLRAKRGEQLKQELQQSKKPSLEEQSDASYFDPRLSTKLPNRQRRMFNFNEEGKYVKLAQRLRTKAQLEYLQDSVAAAAKRTGIASAAKLASIQPNKVADETVQPDIEWWDAYLLNTDEQNYSVLDNAESVRSVINPAWITHLVEHPIKMAAPTDLDKPPEIPMLLTKKERKKLRRQRRLEVQKEEQEKVRLGLIPPAEPKVRLANLMRVLGTDAVQDPTKIEAYVRAQMAKRKKAHEAANAARKLTKEQAKDKKSRKLKEDTSRGVHVAVYRVRDLNNPSHKFKVETNCNQLYMTGLVALHKDCNVVVVEGGPKQQKKFKQLMLNRIRWSQLSKRSGAAAAAALAAANEAAGISAEAAQHKAKMPHCVLVWEGTVKNRAFDAIQFKMCPTELFAREQFRKFNVEQYWDLAYSSSVLEAAGDESL